MALMRQVHRPATGANWTEHLYHKEVKVVNGEVETDDPDTINALMMRGFREVDPAQRHAPVTILGKMYREGDPKPEGTQVVTADNADDILENAEAPQESEHADEKSPQEMVGEARAAEEPAPVTKADVPTEPVETDTQTPKPSSGKKRGRPRKTPQGEK